MLGQPVNLNISTLRIVQFVIPRNYVTPLFVNSHFPKALSRKLSLVRRLFALQRLPCGNGCGSIRVLN